MPYAQLHYPFENKELFNQSFPADFIAEGVDQTRGWFYTLTVLSTLLFEKPAFKVRIDFFTILSSFPSFFLLCVCWIVLYELYASNTVYLLYLELNRQWTCSCCGWEEDEQEVRGI